MSTQAQPLSGADVYRQAAQRAARPDPDLKVSEWADKYRNLTLRSSPEPGPWRTSRVPYLRDIMDDLSPSSRVRLVVMMAGAQIGKTEAGNNWVGFNIHLSPGPMMCVMPTVEMAKRNSKQRIAPLIEDSSVLRKLVKEARSKDSGNTVLTKEFPGGILVMVGANSAKGLRSMSARYLFLDEVDGYPGDVDGEGEPCNLAMVRTTNFPRAKIFITSTPVISGRSRIERFYYESDQRQYWLPCPHCEAYQVLAIAQLRWPKGRPHQAKYYCVACARPIDNHAKEWMLPRGEWRPQNPDADPAIHGYHASSLLSPQGWLSWARVAAQKEAAGSDPEKLQVFTNTVLGLPWTEEGEVPDADRLYERREAYPIGRVPAGGLLLTCGVDVQLRRIECEIVAWGRNKESWSVDYRVFEGETNQPAVWAEVAALLDETFKTSYGGPPMQIRRLAVDSGFNTTTVYDWVRKMPRTRVMCVKGETKASNVVGLPSLVETGPQGKRIRYGVRLWPVNTSIAKEELYRWLRGSVPDAARGEKWPTGYCHFPAYGKEYFEQLCAERLVTRTVAGRRTTKWELTRDRNEALDCFDAETEVLTNDGWHRFVGLSSAHKLATVELETDRIEYQIPTELISRYCDSEMISLHGRRLDILVTPNHRMVTYLPHKDAVKAKIPLITLAKDLTQRHQIKLTAQWTQTGPCCITIPASIKDDSGSEIEPARNVKAIDLAAFYGWWITEGSAVQVPGTCMRRVSICQTKEVNLPIIAALLDRLPWHFNWTASNSKFTCTSKQLFAEVSQWGRLQSARRVPTWIKEAGTEVIAAFMDAAVMGDGWSQRDGGRVIATICKELADDYQELFVKLGSAPRIHVRKAVPYTIRGHSGTETQDQYHVHENPRIKKASLDGGGNGSRGYIGKMVPHDGMVYCATVPNGTLICRRNGQVFIAGNCRIYARAAAASLRIETWADQRWEQMQTELMKDPRTTVADAPGRNISKTPMPQFKPFRAREDFLE